MQRKSRVSGEYPKTLLRFFNREEYARKFIEGHLRVRKSVDVPRKTSRRQSGRTWTLGHGCGHRKSRVSGEYPKTLLRFFNRVEYARKFIEGHLRVRKSVDVPRKTSRRQSGRTWTLGHGCGHRRCHLIILWGRVHFGQDDVAGGSG